VTNHPERRHRGARPRGRRRRRFYKKKKRAAGGGRGNDLMLETPCSEPAPFFNNKALLLNPNITDFASPLIVAHFKQPFQ
jgi:hypothetical protein